MHSVQEGMNGFFYVARGQFVGANGQEVPGYAFFDQWEIFGQRFRFRPPEEGLGDLHQATDLAGRPLCAVVLKRSFYPYRFRPDRPLPALPSNLPVAL
ncbi:MAG: hypothetical protein ACM3XM_09385 [Mycobacterium leprae]